MGADLARQRYTCKNEREQYEAATRKAGKTGSGTNQEQDTRAEEKPTFRKHWPGPGQSGIIGNCQNTGDCLLSP